MAVNNQSRAERAGSPSQEGRFTKLFLPDESERLVLHRFAGTEAVSRLFEFQVEAFSHEVDFDLGTLLGKAVGVSYRSHQNVERFFNGVVAAGEWTGAQEEKQSYRLTLRPWLWLLGRRADCKIHKNKTIPDIIESVFQGRGFSDYQIELTHAFKPQEYVVQYGETDLAFVSRLMEEWGIYYYFKHEKNRHVLHLVDQLSLHPKISIVPDPGAAGGRSGGRSSSASSSASNSSAGSGSSLVYRPLEGRSRRHQEHLTAWRAERQVRTGRVELRDYDYMNARMALKGESQGQETYRHASLESYDYRGRWAVKDGEGTHLAKVRLEAEQALDHRKFGIGDAPSLYPGGYVTLSGHMSDDDDYLVVAARHRFASHEYRSGGGGGDEQPYEGAYEFQPQSRPFRAPFVTPRPRIFGPQTAFVTTRKGVAKSEEIDVDKDGRIAVNFHWNRGDPNADCSRDVRVAQNWAGKGWGFQFIPRVGMEVVVEYLDGDPDQPLVTGAVYNSDFPFPYKMPDNKTQSGIKTNSSIDTSLACFNELRFEDKKGSEEVYFRAEKDHNSLIQNVETRTILNHLTTEIGKNFDGRGNSKHDGVSQQTIVHHGSVEEVVVDGNKNIVIADGDYRTTVKKGDKTTKLQLGDYDLDVTGAITVTATTSITLKIKGGQTSIKLDTTGITLKGPMININ